MAIYDYLPTYRYIEPNNLKGLLPGFVVAQVEDVDAELLDEKGMFANGAICAVELVEGKLTIVAAEAADKAVFIHFTEPLNTIRNSDKYFAVNVKNECPRLVQLIPGDEWMSSEKLEEDVDDKGEKIGILGGRIVEVTAQEGWYGVKTMANGDAGYHYVFLG